MAKKALHQDTRAPTEKILKGGEMELATQIGKGDYFYTSWGYDQTNIDYLVVIDISKSGKTATCRMVSPINVGTQGVEDVLMPGTPYGEPFRMVFRDGRLRGSYPYCKGGKRLDSFYPTTLGETKNQTMPQFGH